MTMNTVNTIIYAFLVHIFDLFTYFLYTKIFIVLWAPLKPHSMGPPGWGQSEGLEWVRCGEWLKMEVLSHYEYL